MKIVERSIEVLFYVEREGLFLNKINYHDGIIQTVKFLYSDIQSKIFEDTNSLSFYSQYMFLILDKDYNI